MNTSYVSITNPRARLPAVIKVWAKGPDDYRVCIEGVGEHSRVARLDRAVKSAQWLASLDDADFGYEILMTLDATDKETS
jgi:hypothetical protein